MKSQPSGEFVQPEQIGALAAASITGTSLPIDGGWTAR
jgi:hypothetical protein